MVKTKNVQTSRNKNRRIRRNSNSTFNNQPNSFTKTVYFAYPLDEKATRFDIIKDKPNDFQIEICNAALIQNIFTYLPAGSSRMHIVAMFSKYLKNLNATKNAILITDTDDWSLIESPLKFLKLQTGLLVSHQVTEDFATADILIISCKQFNHMLSKKQLKLLDFCCLIFDELQHAIESNHFYAKFFENFYQKLDPALRPRIVGIMTELYSTKDQHELSPVDVVLQILTLSNLLDAKFFIPVEKHTEFELKIESLNKEEQAKKLPRIKTANNTLLSLADLFASKEAKTSLQNINPYYSHDLHLCNLLVHLCENENEIVKLYRNLHYCKGFLNVDLKARDYHFEFHSKSRTLNCSFEISNDFTKLTEIISQSLVNLNKVCISLRSINKFLPKSDLKKEFSYPHKIEFGNLATPFEFFSHRSSSSELSSEYNLIFDFDRKHIQICLKQKKDLIIDLSFDSIDNLICVDLARNNENICIYLPLNRMPNIYCLSILSLLSASGRDRWIRECGLLTDASNLTIKLVLGPARNNQDLAHIIKYLSKIEHVHILFSRVNLIESFGIFTIDRLRSSFQDIRSDFSSRYKLEVFITQCSYFLNGKLDQIFLDILLSNNNTQAKQLEAILSELINQLPAKRFLNINEILISIMSEVEKRRLQDNSIYNEEELFDPSLKIKYMRRMTVTPSRILFYFEEPNYSNRVIREFDHDRFLRVRFRDENLQRLNPMASGAFADMSKVYDRIRNLLNMGLELVDRKYHFLAMSASQMREHGCWLFAASAKYSAENIRASLGDFSKINNIGKYAARLGQSLSSSIETFQAKNFSVIPDIMDRFGYGYNFTDGIGKISKEKANEISMKYYKNKYVSTFQIRLGGFKGVVAMDPNLSRDELQFRESMKKFESMHTKLEVLKIANFMPCYLNRQIIIILSSLGVHDYAFVDLQDKMINSISEIVIDKHTADTYLQQYFRSVFSEYTHNKPFMNYTFDPFFRAILFTIYQKILISLIKKSKIFVEKGRVLMGCIDETGSLAADEIFVQCTRATETFNSKEILNSELDSKYFILNARCIVAKNPCMHPGDVRILNAVDSLKLRHLVDCVVFPAIGPRPITNMCSGSDLDGDLYFVAWEPTLIPPKTLEAMDYNAPPPLVKENVTINDIVDFFVGFIKMDQLGIISNTHLALADKRPLGVRDPDCVELAKMFSLAVDFPKTGVVKECPMSLRKNIEYPDFMERRKNTYKSEKVIGIMYRKCKSIFKASMDTTRHKMKPGIDLNPSLLFKGYEAYIHEATESYLEYRERFIRIMAMVRCKSESEVFLGKHFAPTRDDDARDAIKLSISMIKNLWAIMRERHFFKRSVNTTGIDLLQKASAWYHVAYTSELNKECQILSFPWILEDVFYAHSRSPEFKEFNIKNYDALSKSMLRKITCDSRKFQFFERLDFKLHICDEISYESGQDLIIAGSQGLFLFDKQISRMLDLKVISNNLIGMNSVFDNLSNKYANLRLVNQNWLVYHTNKNNDFSFSIKQSQAGVKRFLHLRRSIFENSHLLPIFYTIVNLAMYDKLLDVFEAENVELEDYLEFCLDYFKKKSYLKKVVEESDREFDELCGNLKLLDSYDDWIEVLDNLEQIEEDSQYDTFLEQIGTMLLHFYKDHSFEDDILFEKKFNANNSMITLKNPKQLQTHFFKMFNLISKNSTVDSLF